MQIRRIFPRISDDVLVRGALFSLQLAALAWFGSLDGLPLDDAWIHQVVARTFAETGTLGYAAGQHGAGATSYLWAALLAVNLKWLHISPVVWAFLLNAASSLLTGQLVYALLARVCPTDFGSRPWRITAFAAALLGSCGPNVLWFAHSGMEASLLIGLSITAVWAATRPTVTVRAGVLAGTACALLALTRPEGAGLALLLGAAALYRRQGVRRFVALVAPTALAVLVYAGSNLSKTGRMLPSTLSGRRWLWFEMSSGLTALDRARDFADAWALRLGSFTFDTSHAGFWVMFGVAGYGVVRVLRIRNDGVRLLFAWAALHTAFYLVLLPTPGHGGRYQPFVPLLYAASVGLGSAFIVHDVTRVLRKPWGWLAPVGAVPWLVFAVAVTADLREANRLAVAHIQATELGAGAFVRSLPKDAVVASFDIGGIGWVAGRPILDAGGLSDPKTAELLAAGRIWEYLRDHAVSYVVLPEGYEHLIPLIDDFASRLHLRHNPAVRIEPRYQLETPFPRWRPAILATWNAAPKQVVYAISYTGAAPAAEVPAVPSHAQRPIQDRAELVPSRARAMAAHMFAVLEAWGVPVDVVLTASRETPPDAAGKGCVLRLGAWGAGVDGCEAIADPAVLRSMLYEDLAPYLDANDLGGALRYAAHVVARAKRMRDPRFEPPLPPVEVPGGAPEAATRSSSVVLFPAVFGGTLLLGLLAAGRLRLRRRERTSMPRVQAAATLTGVLVALASSACHGNTADTASRGRGALEMAVARGADLEARDREGRTALLVATAAGDIDSLAFLLAHGARVDVQDDAGNAPLHLAARLGNASVIVALAAAGASTTATAGPRKRTPLHEAVSSGAPRESIRALLRAGANPNEADTFGQTPLHALARLPSSRGPETASLLLAAGADPLRADLRGYTAAHAAAASDDVPLLQQLLAASPEARDRATPSGDTPLAIALRAHRDGAAECLLAAGAIPSETDPWPPLHEAARMDDVPRATALLAVGADVSRVFRGETAAEVAGRYESGRIRALLAWSRSNGAR